MSSSIHYWAVGLAVVAFWVFVARIALRRMKGGR